MPKGPVRTLLSLVAIVLAQSISMGTALAAQGHVDRLAGDDRYDTMSAIVGSAFDRSEWAVIACGESFPDSLSASALAGSKVCPVVLTPRKALGAQARSRLSSLGVTRAYVVGGEAAVSKQAEADIRAMGIEVQRVSGADRTATSVAAMRLAAGRSRTVVIATGRGFADSLAIGPWSYRTCSPIVLAGSDGRLPDGAASAIREAGFADYVVVGGPSAVSEGVADQLSGLRMRARLGGADRYGTARAIVSWELADGGMGTSELCVATGQGFADALAGASLAGSRNSVMALVSDADVSALRAVTEGNAGLSSVHVLGGSGSVSPLVYNALANAFGQKPETGLIRQGGKVRYYDEYGRMATAGAVGNYVVGYDGVCRPVDLSATGNPDADALRVARAVAEAAGPRDGRTDLERVAQAAYTVKCFCDRARYSMEGSIYRTAYGVFVAGEYSCAGSTRALGLVLDCMGYPWSHANENQYTHQWNVLAMDGKPGYADGMGGFVGYGTHPSLGADANGRYTIDAQPSHYEEIDLGMAGAVPAWVLQYL